MRQTYKVTRNDFKTKAERCARDIIDWCIKREDWIDICIYVNGKRYSCYSPDGKYDYSNTWDAVYCEDNVNPKDYIEYGGDFLTMSFDGGSMLYEIFNYYMSTSYCDKRIEEFDNIINKYGKYYELGYAWSLSLYDL